MTTLPFRIMAVDPATGLSGWSILDVTSLTPLAITIIATGKLDGQKLLRTRKEMSTIYPPQFCVLDALLEEYKLLMTQYQPNQVVSESAFGYKHMNALVSLTLAINVLRTASCQILNKDIATVPPTITKRAFAGNGGADKDHMRLAYQSNKYLTGVVPDDQISEHEIDSIGHGIAWVKVHVTKEITQVSAKEKKAKKREKEKLKTQSNTG